MFLCKVSKWQQPKQWGMQCGVALCVCAESPSSAVSLTLTVSPTHCTT